jgi:hypothetical protein
VPACYTRRMGDGPDHYTAKPLARLLGCTSRTAAERLRRLEAVYGPPVVVRVPRGRAIPAPYARLLVEGRLPLDGSGETSPSAIQEPATSPHQRGGTGSSATSGRAPTSAAGTAKGGALSEGSGSPYSPVALAARLALLEAQVSDIARVLRLRGILRRG